MTFLSCADNTSQEIRLLYCDGCRASLSTGPASITVDFQQRGQCENTSREIDLNCDRNPDRRAHFCPTLPGLGAPQTLKVCGVGPHQTNKPSFMGASAHFPRSRTASSDPRWPPGRCQQTRQHLEPTKRSVLLAVAGSRYRSYPLGCPNVQFGALRAAAGVRLLVPVNFP